MNLYNKFVYGIKFKINKLMKKYGGNIQYFMDKNVLKNLNFKVYMIVLNIYKNLWIFQMNCKVIYKCVKINLKPIYKNHYKIILINIQFNK